MDALVQPGLQLAQFVQLIFLPFKSAYYHLV